VPGPRSARPRGSSFDPSSGSSSCASRPSARAGVALVATLSAVLTLAPAAAPQDETAASGPHAASPGARTSPPPAAFDFNPRWNAVQDAVEVKDLALAQTLLERLAADIAAEPRAPAGEAREVQRYAGWLAHVATLDADAVEQAVASERLQGEVAAFVNRGDARGAQGPMQRLIVERERLFGESHPSTIEDLHMAAAIHRALGDYAAAEGYVQRSEQLARAFWDEPSEELVDVLIEVASVHTMRGRMAEAKAAAAEARALADSLSLRATVRLTLLNLQANVAQAMGERVEAESHLAGAVAAAEVAFGRHSGSYLTILFNLATILIEQGELARAEPLLQRGVQVAEEVQVTAISKGLLYLSLGDLHRKRGDTERALPLVIEGLTFIETHFGTHHSQYAVGLGNLADCLQGQGHLEQAETVQRTGVELLADALGPHHPITSDAQRALARLLEQRGRPDEALALLEEIVGEASGAEPASRRLAWLELARLHQLAAQPERAMAALDAAAALLPSSAGVDPAGRVVQGEVAGRRGLLLLAAGEVTSAREHLAQATALYELNRVAVGQGYERAAYVESPHALLAEASLRGGDGDAAWQAVEGGRARALLDLLLGGENAAGSGDPASTPARLRGAHRLQLVDAVERARAAFEQAEAGRRDEERAQLVAAESALAALDGRLDERGSLDAFEVFPIERVQRSLPDDGALMGWLAGHDGTRWAWVLRSEDAVSWVELPRGDDALPWLLRDDLVAATESLFGAPDPQQVRPASRALAEQILHPVLPLLAGVRRLTVIPGEGLADVPIECLTLPDGRWLDEAYGVSYAPSATVATWLAERPARRGGHTGALLVGDPPFRAEHALAMDAESPDGDITDVVALRSAALFQPAALPRLPGTRWEVERLAALCDGPTLLLGRDASEQRLTDLAQSGALSRFDVIHLATHARADGEHPERSELILSQVGLPDAYETSLEGRRPLDGRLTAGEILAQWDLDARLVTLSACSTSRGQQLPGEGTVGLAQAFLQVGARQLLVSQWPVDDRATALFMEAFYGAFLQEAQPAATALSRARAALRDWTDAQGTRPYAHPGYWAAFVLVGPSI
jgi:CHAT domain-containing protein/tetratricopeptide (TPR) repeat protein